MHNAAIAEPATDPTPETTHRRERKPGARRWGKTVSLQTMRREARPLSDHEELLFVVYEKPTNRTECRPEGIYIDPKTGTSRPYPAGRLRVWGDRACPWVSCRHHLALSVSPSNGIKELVDWQEDGQPVCALDIADEGGTTLDRTGHLEGITRERVRQIETRALVKLRAEGVELAHREVAADDER